jgi:transcription initiation factor TFIIB
MNDDKCPRCGGDRFIRDYVRGDLICKGCGFILEERLVDTGPDWYAQEEKKKHAGPPISETVYDRGVSSRISRTDKDVYGRKLTPTRAAAFRRLRKIDQRARMTNSERTLVLVLQEQARLCYNLALPNPIKERAAILTRKVIKERTLRGTSVEAVAAAAVYLACREFGISREMREIARESGVSEKKIRSTYCLLTRLLRVTPSQFEIIYLVHETAKKLGLPSTLRAAIIERLKGQRASSRKVAQKQVAIAIYEECRKAGKPITQARIAEALDLSRASLSRLAGTLRSGRGTFVKSEMNETNPGLVIP